MRVCTNPFPNGDVVALVRAVHFTSNRSTHVNRLVVAGAAVVVAAFVFTRPTKHIFNFIGVRSAHTPAPARSRSPARSFGQLDAALEHTHTVGRARARTRISFFSLRSFDVVD